MELSDRKKRILAAVIDDYIQNAEPVGSKTIAQNSDLGLSSATIRNEMAELEDLGFLEQPHTSAGRIPSPMGYRLYVNELMRRHMLSIEETEDINRQLRQRVQQLDRLIADVGAIATQLTSLPAWTMLAPAKATVQRFDLINVDASTIIVVAMLSNHTVKSKLVHVAGQIDTEMFVRLGALVNANFVGLTEDKITIELIALTERAAGDNVGFTAIIAAFVIEILAELGSGEAHLTGVSHLLRQPEYRDPDKAHRMMNFLSDGGKLLELPSPALETVKVIIGPENLAEELKDSSVIMAGYNAGDGLQGMIGVVGPTRIDYARVAARLKYLAAGIGRLFTSESHPPPDKDDEDKGDAKF